MVRFNFRLSVDDAGINFQGFHTFRGNGLFAADDFYNKNRNLEQN